MLDLLGLSFLQVVEYWGFHQKLLVVSCLGVWGVATIRMIDGDPLQGISMPPLTATQKS